ncbi:cyclopropane-fatty-acyl-phospholipid synthase family protein [Nocardioides sp. cx-173]|uniref:SAM-dependent methyltransferase n=1 Tax=Nocardioides sp. cx-173 TaxID=2898796 RepID=UPI001E6322B7|nr:cyclopropane-fatty-acyl-phospholipid synthase family protein [Nocardioides sp. cx-173]MCD4523880.1 cyclopropane-fatty-acyl-phospholipid synthase family protein [Nocardioides sp. cx-173]UGB41801.1 cyclopropane-fatty-acyl-phospholipid synthase family protein [Nocardioides sp. cx-173]
MTMTPARPLVNHWPGLDVVPTGPRAAISARVAKRLFRAAIDRLDVTVLAGEETFGRGGPVAVVHRPEELYARIGQHQLIGFGEAYLTGAWDAQDLGGFLTVLAAEISDLVPQSLQRLRAAIVARPPRGHRNSEANTRDNIAHHYDLSNELFQQFLDPTLSYSSALFPGDVVDRGEHLQAAAPYGVPVADDLHDAQARKIERLLDEAGVGAGTRLLEIGSGWGELAVRAARRGATVRTITLSTEQQALARERVAVAGLSDLVSVDLCDYRAVEGSYDAVVSVEMIEAVGWEYWRTYFETIDRVLAPGGRVAIQAITMPHERMLATRRTYTWINKYIFPGGFLPSVRALDEVTSAHTGLSLTGRLSMGTHYAETLRLWDEAFLAASQRVLGLGFDETFLRMWHFYLEYSRAGFAAGYLDVNQLTFARLGEGA